MALKSVLVVMACMTTLATAAAAQDRSQPGTDGGQAATADQREDARRKIEALRMARLTETLRLDEKTAAKFIPAITMIGQKRREQIAEHHQAISDIRQQLGRPPADAARLRTAVDRVFGNQREMMKLRERELDAIRGSLTLEQQARYLVFQQEFMQEVRDVLSGSPAPRRGFHGRAAPRRQSAAPDATQEKH